MVRAQSIRRRNEGAGDQRMGESRLQQISRLQNDFRKTIVDKLNLSNHGKECALCLMEIADGEKVD